MPEIKFKHVVSFSSEDKVHKAENLIKPETYRKWKCGSPGEKNATVVLQLEKASTIHSIDIGNEGSAFIEVLVGRSSDSMKDFQVLLVASSFMSPLESRNETHTNRVRMFGPDKLTQNIKDEKWDCVQIVCTQPFNKNLAYGLSFIKLHSPPEKTPEAGSASESFGAFKVKDDEEESLLSVGTWFGKQKSDTPENSQGSVNTEDSPSYAAAVLASSNLNNTLKRKGDDIDSTPNRPPLKKPPGNGLNKDNITYKPLDVTPERKAPAAKVATSRANKNTDTKKANNAASKPSTSNKPAKEKKKLPFNKQMEKVVFVLSGFVNPLRSELRDKALEMGAKYKADWDKSCTHLVCAFLNTPKYQQVRNEDGIIVTKEWILDCHKKKTLLPWRDYMMGKYSKDSSSEEEEEEEEMSSTSSEEEEFIVSDGESEDEYQIRPKKVVLNKAKRVFRLNGTQSSNKKDADVKKKSPVKLRPKASPYQKSNYRELSETDDEEAIADYMADTDADEHSDSGGDTEDEIRKVESKAKKTASSKKGVVYLDDDESPKKPNVDESTQKPVVDESPQKPNVDDLPLPDLPNLFKQKHFYLFGDFISSKHHDLQRYITAYNGVIEDYMSSSIKYVITEAKWDSTFEEALNENEDLIFIKPLWIYKCHESQKLVPYQPYIVIPDS